MHTITEFQTTLICFSKTARSEKVRKTRADKSKIMDFKKQMHQYNTTQTTKLHTCGKLFKIPQKKREKHNNCDSLFIYQKPISV